MAKPTLKSLSTMVDELSSMVDELEEVLICLEDRLHKPIKLKSNGRKGQVLDLLKQGPQHIGVIAKRLGIQPRNVSSLLAYLKKDGYDIVTTTAGKKELL